MQLLSGIDIDRDFMPALSVSHSSTTMQFTISWSNHLKTAYGWFESEANGEEKVATISKTDCKEISIYTLYYTMCTATPSTYAE